MKILISRQLTLLFFLSFYLFSNAQAQLSEGFKHLEVGNFAAAETFFGDYLKEDPSNQTAKLCYGRAIGLNGKAPEAMKIFDNLVAKDSTNIEFLLNQAECFLWMSNFKGALVKYKKLEKTHDDNPIVHLGLGNTYSNLKKFKTAIKHYNKGITLNPKVLGIYIGLANTQFAYNQNKEALVTIKNGLAIDSTNSNLNNLQTRINNKYLPQVLHKTSLTFDSGKNRSVVTFTKFDYHINTKAGFTVMHNYKRSKSQLENIKAHSHRVKAGFNYQLRPNIRFESLIGVNTTKSFTQDYRDWVADVSLTVIPKVGHLVKAGFKKEYHDFNAALMDLSIDMKHYHVMYHHLTKLKLGVFTQYYYTTQSDANSRHLWFSSLYYLWSQQPGFKTGVNYLNIHFKNQVPMNYFSPEVFHSLELFADFAYNKEAHKFYANATVAYGYQFIEDDPKIDSFRCNGEVGYKPNFNWKLGAFGQYSNLASGNAAGFSFSEVGIKIRYIFPR